MVDIKNCQLTGKDLFNMGNFLLYHHNSLRNRGADRFNGSLLCFCAGEGDSDDSLDHGEDGVGHRVLGYQ